MGTGSYSSGSPTVTDVNNQIGAFEVGMEFWSSSSDIPDGTTITAVDTGANTLTLSANATGNRTDVGITGSLPSVTNVSATSGTFAVGQTISNTRIPSGTTITAVDTGANTLTLDKAPTHPGTGVELYAASAEATNVATDCGTFEVGQTIYGEGIPGRTEITAVGSDTLTLSNAPIAEGAGGALFATSSFSRDSSINGSDPRSLAFDQAAGRLYALDSIADSIYAFESPGLGTAIAGFPLTVDSSGHFLNSIAVDNSSEASARRLYLTKTPTGFSSDPGVVHAFDSAGNELTAPSHPNFPLPVVTDTVGGRLCGAATDSAGNLWIGDQRFFSALADRHYLLRQYSPNGALLRTLEVKEPRSEPCGPALDAEDNLYVTSRNGGELWRHSAADDYNPATAEQIGSGQRTIAFDHARGLLYTLDIARNPGLARIYTTEGDLLGEFGGGVAGANYLGIAVDEANGIVYLADARNAQAHAFGMVSVPDVLSGAATDLTAAAATLSGTVDPLGDPVTECYFQYTSEAQFVASRFKGAAEAPCETDPGSGAGPVAVSADAGGLDPGTEYRFRLRAANANGTSPPADTVAFTTLGPQVRAESFAAQRTSATLRAEVNPNGEATSYRFELVTQAQFEASGFTGATQIPAAPVALGAASAYQQVSQQVGGLTPGATYRFRAVAANPSATVAGRGAGFTTLAIDNSSCANEPLRQIQGSTFLPDCRAYEQVSPIDKAGFDILPGPVWATREGEAAAFISVGGFAGAAAGATPNAYGASRGADGWQTTALQPPWGRDHDLGSPSVLGANADFTLALVLSNRVLAPGGVDREANLYLREAATDSYQFVATIDATGFLGTAAARTHVDFAGASADGARFFLGTDDEAPLDSTPPTSGGNHLYEFSGGVLKPAGILPNGAVAATSEALEAYLRPVSEDGERYYFSARASTESPGLYVRAGSQTVQVTDGSGSPRFEGASADGQIAYYTKNGRLHRYEAATETSTEIGGGEPIANRLLGLSEDGEAAYFSSSAALDGARAVNCGSPSAPGPCNLFAWRGGEITHIATLGTKPDTFGLASTATASPNGRYLAFLTLSRLDGPHPQPQRALEQAYLYDQLTETLVCASCPPASVEQHRNVSFGASAYTNQMTVATVFEAWGRPQRLTGSQHSLLRRNVTDAGQLFFESEAALVSADTNGSDGCPPVPFVALGRDETIYGGTCRDVYAYQAGNVELISTGKAEEASYFGDASAAGGEAFVLTAEGLVAGDLDSLYDVYAAKVNGGLASQNPPAEAPCEGEGCRGAGPPAPAEAGNASAALESAGNLSPLPARCRRLARRAARGARAAKALRGRAARLGRVGRRARNPRRAAAARGKARRARRAARKRAVAARRARARATRCRRASR